MISRAARCVSALSVSFISVARLPSQTSTGPQPAGTKPQTVALCGDALLEPFWPMGLGLKRGWQALMDT